LLDLLERLFVGLGIDGGFVGPEFGHDGNGDKQGYQSKTRAEHSHEHLTP
jgi:hypothetical protein